MKGARDGDVRRLSSRLRAAFAPLAASLLVLLPALSLALSGCAGGVASGGAAALSGEDRDALAELSLFAARDAFAGDGHGDGHGDVHAGGDANDSGSDESVPGGSRPGVAGSGGSGLSGARAVECWAPSAHLFEGQRFRVLCRVHFDEAGAPRYRDMICIGEIGRDPVSDGCYQWAPYTDTPAFEDEPAYPAYSV